MAIDNVGASLRTTDTSLLAAAQAAVRAGQLAHARGLLVAATVLHPSNLEAWLLLGWIAPEPATALDCFQRALAIDPGNVLAADGLAWATEQIPGATPRVSPATRRQAETVAIPPRADPQPSTTIDEYEDRTHDPSEARSSVIPSTVGVSIEQGHGPSAQPETVVREAWEPVQAMPTAHDTRSAERGRWFNRNLRLPLIYLVALSLAEIITTQAEPRLGLVLYGSLIVALPLSAVFAPRGPLQKLPLTLAIVPLIRLLSLSLPLSGFPFMYWYVIVGAPLFLAGFLVVRALGFTRAHIGLKVSAVAPQLLISLSGIAVGCLEYLILRPPALISAPTWDQLWLPALILLVFTGFLEEFLFRGLMQRAATESLGRIGVLYVAIIFAVLHAGYSSLIDVVFVFAVGWYFGLIAARTGSIFGVTLAHGLANIGLFLIFPFLLGAPG